MKIEIYWVVRSERLDSGQAVAGPFTCYDTALTAKYDYLDQRVIYDDSVEVRTQVIEVTDDVIDLVNDDY